MADDACLVDFEEVPDTSYDPSQGIRSLPLRDKDVTSGANFSILQETGRNPSEVQDRVVPDLIIAVYVVQFDTRRGKTLYDTCSTSLFIISYTKTVIHVDLLSASIRKYLDVVVSICGRLLSRGLLFV